jgi:hypothetical protein
VHGLPQLALTLQKNKMKVGILPFSLQNQRSDDLVHWIDGMSDDSCR